MGLYYMYLFSELGCGGIRHTGLHIMKSKPLSVHMVHPQLQNILNLTHQHMHMYTHRPEATLLTHSRMYFIKDTSGQDLLVSEWSDVMSKKNEDCKWVLLKQPFDYKQEFSTIRKCGNM